MSLPFDDITVDVQASRVGGTSPSFAKLTDDGAGSLGIYANRFNGGANNDIYFGLQLPHAWAQGTVIHPHLHWCPETNIANGETVHWVLEWTWCNIDGVVGASTVNSTVAYTSSGTTAAKTHILTELDDMVGTGKTVSSLVYGRIQRQSQGAGADTFAGNVFLLAFDIHVQKDAHGSLNEFYKP